MYDHQSGKQSNVALYCLLATPFLYFLVVSFPPPFGFGLVFDNDFPEHRIWWVQTQAYYIWKGYFPLWNPIDTFGVLYPGWRGWAITYPFSWWLLLVAKLGGPLNYYGQYFNLATHMAVGLLGVYVLVRRYGNVSKPAAVLGALVFLLNQRFNDFIRYPNGIEMMVWVPWVIYFCLSIVRDEEPRKYKRLGVLADTNFLCLCLTSGFMWLAGYGVLSYLVTMAFGIICLLGGRSFWQMIVAVGGYGVGVFLASGQLLSTSVALTYVPDRSGGIKWAADFPLGVSYLEMIAHPFSVDVTASCFFLPVFAAFLIIGLIAGFLDKRSRRISVAMLAVLLLMGDLARGLDGYLFEFFYYNIPKYHVLHHQARSNWISLIPVAWFCSFGVESLFQSRQYRHIPLVILIAVMAVIVGNHFWVSVNAFVWSPIANKWVSVHEASRYFLLLAFGSLALTVAYIFITSNVLRALAVFFLVILFVSTYAIKATYFNKDFQDKALWPTSNFYKDGVLAFVDKGSFNRLKGPVFITIHADNPTYDAYTKAVCDRSFPGSRFVFYPDKRDEGGNVKLAVDRFGPNHFDFQVQADVAGDLLFFSTFSDQWSANVKMTRPAGVFSTYTQMHIERGTTQVKMRYRPYAIIVLFGINILSLWCIGAVLLHKKERFILRNVAVLIGVALFALYVYGVFNTKSMEMREVIGADDIPAKTFLPVPLAK